MNGGRPLTIRARKGNWLALLLIAGILLSSCGSGSAEGTPTTSAEQVQTQAVATFAAGLTATSQALPTATPTATETPTATATIPAEMSPTAPTATLAIPTSSCYGLTFVSDVTIPDNTSMTPGQKFTKTWRVRNSGTCAWEVGFKFNFTGGEAMGGSSVKLEKAVEPGKETELSVALTAPSTNGTYRGNWRMTNASGTYFGDEVYVLIVVGGSTATATAKATASPTAPPTVTPTLTETVETTT
jgi:hypothetical protein